MPRPFQMDADYETLTERLFGAADLSSLMENVGAGGKRRPTDGGGSSIARRVGMSSGHRGHGGHGAGSGTRVLKPKLKVIVAFSPPSTTGSANAGSPSYPFVHTSNVLLPEITSPTNTSHRGLGGGTSASSRPGPRTHTPSPHGQTHRHQPTTPTTSHPSNNNNSPTTKLSCAFGANSVALLVGNTISE